MKISQIRKNILTIRQPSTEQGDIQITVNQGEPETPAVDTAPEVPELTDPTASIADQPEVDEALAEVDSDKAEVLEGAETDQEMSEAEQGIAAGEDAVNALESYRVHIKHLLDQKMPVSAATIESLTIGIEHAVGRFNLKAKEIGMPSTESFTASPQASLEALERTITVSQEGIADSINSFVSNWLNKFTDLVTGTKRGLEKQNARLDKLTQSINQIQISGPLPVITNKKVIDSIELIALESKSGKDVLTKIHSVNNGIVEIFKTRVATVETAVDAAIKSIINGEDDAVVSEKLRADITKVLFADNRVIDFWVNVTPITATVLAGSLFLAGNGATLVEAGIGAVAAGGIAGVKIGKVLSGAATTKTPALFRKKKAGTAILNEVPTLTPAEVSLAVKSTKDAIAATLAYRADQSDMAKELTKILDSKFKTAERQSINRELDATSDEEGDAHANVTVGLSYVRTIVRDMYSVESAIVRGVRYSVPGVVDYLVESIKVAQAATKAAETAE